MPQNIGPMLALVVPTLTFMWAVFHTIMSSRIKSKEISASEKNPHYSTGQITFNKTLTDLSLRQVEMSNKIIDLLEAHKLLVNELLYINRSHETESKADYKDTIQELRKTNEILKEIEQNGKFMSKFQEKFDSFLNSFKSIFQLIKQNNSILNELKS